VNTDFYKLVRAVQYVYVRPRGREHLHEFFRNSIRCRGQLDFPSPVRFLDLFEVYDARNYPEDRDRTRLWKSRQVLRELGRELKSMPHLKTLGLNYLDLDKSIMIAFAGSSIKNLRVRGDFIIHDEEDSAFWEMSNIAKMEWPLETLEAQGRIFYKGGGRWECVRDLLWMCRKTLQRFACIELLTTDTGVSLLPKDEDSNDVSKIFAFTMPEMGAFQLPKLRQLYCLRYGKQDLCLDAMLLNLNLWAKAAPNLEFISCEGGTQTLSGDQLEDLPDLAHIPSLRGIRSQLSTIEPFLKNNPQITIYDAHTAWHMYDQYMCPDLSRLCAGKLFNNLTSLSLELDGSYSRETLGYVAQLPLLEQLLLDGDHWNIDHDEVLAMLQPLGNLRCLAFMRDIYIKSWTHSTFSCKEDGDELEADYWKPISLTPSKEEIDHLRLDLNIMELAEISDKVHHHRMQLIAERYAVTFSKLEWIFVGCHPFANSNGVIRSLSKRRVLGDELMEHVFGVIKHDRIFRPLEEDKFYGSPESYKGKIPPNCTVM